MIKLLTVLLFMLPLKLLSQDSLLTIQRAYEITLEKNFDIRLAEITSEKEENNNTAGNAGMLPSVDATGSYTRASNSIRQKYNTGGEVNRDASESTNLYGDVGAEWIIFDGLRMFSAKKRLSQTAMQSKEQLKIQMEQALFDMTVAYYAVVRDKQLLRAMREEIALSGERLLIAERRMNNGSGSKLDWLQAKTEMNRQLAIEIQLKSDEQESRTRLITLLGNEVNPGFTVEDTVIISIIEDYTTLKSKMNEKNALLRYFHREMAIAQLNLSEARSLRWPVIGVNAHYTYSRSTNEAGFSLLNRTQGFNYGVSATLPLFHGFNFGRQIKNSKLDMLYSELQYRSQQSLADEALENAWRAFNNSSELLKLEEENINFAKEAHSIAGERFRVGISNTVELRESQRTYEEALSRLAGARYNAKVAETNLRRISGELVR